jgi:hypothetical protein
MQAVAAARKPPAAPARTRARSTALFRGFLALCALAVVAINIDGADYYLASLATRVRHPMHAWLKPSGLIGQSLGLFAAALFFFLWLYPIRKKYSARLSATGSVGTWLDWHVSAATHAGWRFTGLVGLGFLAMFLVWLSGIVGRYLYVHIPRRRDGLAMSRDEIKSERNRILFEFTAATGLRPGFVRDTLGRETESLEGMGPIGVLRAMIRSDFERRRAVRAIEKELSRPGAPPIDRATLNSVLKLARKELSLAHQARMLGSTLKLFKYWHVAHRPFAVTALFAVITHIVVAIVFRATWFY